MQSPRTALVLALATLLTTAGPTLAASFTNPGFETGTYIGWDRSSTGGTSIQPGNYTNALPGGGSFQSLASTAFGASPIASLESFSGLTAGSLVSLGGFGGSAIRQTVAGISAGEGISFSWNFLTDEGPASATNDFAFAVVNGQFFRLADTHTTLTGSTSPFDFETGYRRFTFTVPTSGNYTVVVGVVNVGDEFVPSGVLSDNFTVVPEPSAALAGGVLMGAFVLVGRRFRRA